MPRGFAPALLAGALLLPILTGCDERTPQTPKVVAEGLDLSDFGNGPADWVVRRVDQGRIVPADTVRQDGTLWLSVRSREGETGRWRRKVRWPADEFPTLTWSWAPQRKVDSVRFRRRSAPAATLAVDVTLASAFGLHKTVRYVWSARRDKGREYQGDGWHPKVVVLRDASDSIAPATETVDVWADFRRLWGFTPRHQALSVAVAIHDPDPDRAFSARFGPIIARPGKETNR